MSNETTTAVKDDDTQMKGEEMLAYFTAGVAALSQNGIFNSDIEAAYDLAQNAVLAGKIYFINRGVAVSDDMVVKVMAQRNYGAVAYYPANDAAYSFCSLTGCKTIRPQDRKQIEALGFKIVTMPTTFPKLED